MAAAGKEANPEQTGQLSPVGQNLQRVGVIVAAELELLDKGLAAVRESGRGSAIHIEAERNRLIELGGQVGGLVDKLSISEPADSEFVIELLQILEKTDYGIEPGEESARYDLHEISQAVQSLQLRNAGSSQAEAA